MEQQRAAKTGLQDHQKKSHLAVKQALSHKEPINLLLQLHKLIGNQAAGRMIQAKLSVSQPGDTYEQEADRVADHVMRMADATADKEASVMEGAQPVHIQRACTDCEEELSRQAVEEEEEDAALQRKEVTATSPGEAERIKQIRAGGEALPESARAFFEPKFGQDFSQVCIHTDERAASSAREVGAVAYTVGRDIVFGKGKYEPETQAGRRLLAHELTHVIQQGNSKSIQESAGVAGTQPASQPGAKAAESAPAVNALAYTAVSRSVFGAGQYAPATGKGQRLPAHELVHTIKRRASPGAPTIQRAPAQDDTAARESEARSFVNGVLWLMSESIREYRRGDLMAHPDRHPNTLRQDLDVIRSWFLSARDRVHTDLKDDTQLDDDLIRIYRIFVYTALRAFEPKLNKPAWKLYEENTTVIHELAGPPAGAIPLSAMDTLVLPKLKEARCGMENKSVEFCGSVIAAEDGSLRTTGPITNDQIALCGEDNIILQPGERLVGYYHSHPRDQSQRFALADPNLDFTEFDKDQADNRKIIYYLVNWRKEALKYYPKESADAIRGQIIKLDVFKDLVCAP